MTKEEAIAELWSRGETDFLLHEGQLKIEEAYQKSNHPVFGVECARQFGKSYWGVKKADQIARQFPGSSSRIGTAFHTDLDAITLPAFERVLSTCPRDLRPTYKTIGGKFLYPNGSEIRLVGLDRNPDKLRGSRLRLVLLEEAGFGDSDALRYAYNSVIIPAFTHEKGARCVLISTPPQQGNDHSFCELVDAAALHNSYLKLTIYENPMLSKERIEEICRELGGEKAIAWRREALCERIVDTERAIVPEWRKEFELPFGKDELYPYWHKYQALDIGVQVDKTICLFAYYKFNEGRLYVEDEVDVSGSKTTTDKIYEAIISKQRELWGDMDPYRRIADNSHPLLLNDLSAGGGDGVTRRHGIGFAATDKERLHEMVGKVRTWVQQGRLVVHPRCKQLLGCLNTGIWNKTRTDFERSKIHGHYDALAALIYLIRNVDEFSNPLPNYVMNPSGWSVFDKKQNQLSQTGQDIANILSLR